MEDTRDVQAQAKLSPNARFLHENQVQKKGKKRADKKIPRYVTLRNG